MVLGMIPNPQIGEAGKLSHFHAFVLGRFFGGVEDSLSSLKKVTSGSMEIMKGKKTEHIWSGTDG